VPPIYPGEEIVKGFVPRCLLLAAALAFAALPLAAQRRPAARRAARPAASNTPRLGPHLGYNFDAEALLLGAQAAFPLAPAFDLYPTFDVYFVDAGSLWALNLDARYRPPTRFGLLYVGAGIQYLRQSVGGLSGSDTKLNLIGGIEGRRRRAAPYFELRLSLGDNSMFQLAGGVSWRLGT
jgi:hypothetical protein